MIRRSAIVVGVMITCLALVAPASAQMTITHDEKGDAGLADARKVTVHHWKKRVLIKTRMYPGKRLPEEMWHLVDTRGDRTPEFLVFSVVRSEVDDKARAGAYRIDRWPRRANPYRVLHDGVRSDCGLHRASRADRNKLLEITLGRGCFKIGGEMPKRLRVNTFGTWEHGAITDKVPGWRKYGAWTRSG